VKTRKSLYLKLEQDHYKVEENRGTQTKSNREETVSITLNSAIFLRFGP